MTVEILFKLGICGSSEFIDKIKDINDADMKPELTEVLNVSKKYTEQL